MIILVVSLIISSLEDYVSFAKLVFQNYFSHSLKSSTVTKWAGIRQVQQGLKNPSRLHSVEIHCG